MNLRDVDQNESGGALGASESVHSIRDSRSWMDRLFPSRVERTFLLAVYLIGAFYLVFFKIIAIILVVIVRAGGRSR